MNEVTKLYENANIKPDCTYLFLVDGNGENEAARTMSIGSKADLKRLIVDCGVKGKVIKSTNTLKPFYPPFTAKKQLELIKWLGIRDEFNFYQNKVTKDWVFYDHEKDATHYSFELGLASWVNYLWQDLTEEERKQIKDILE